ncbi:hypothetical protein GE09DRAFT_153509 [Coniochaeta sp. 2T2.1]|nr:hypothetical protein GE09DRAFT_153509 [Coniochaeta sp. 2T2.1]
MKTDQDRTYLVYSRGLQPDKLPLGSLFLDPANPLGHERKRWRADVSAAELEAWTGQPDTETSPSFKVHATREWLAGAQILDIFRGEVGRKGVVEVNIEGDVGRRVQIDRPEAFLNEVILPTESARKWIADWLFAFKHSSPFKKRRRGGLTFKPPKIWMVTGVQLVAGARITDTASKTLVNSLAANVPLPEPVAAAMGGFTVAGVEGKKNRARGVEVKGLHPEEKVWAAQFAALKIDAKTISKDAEGRAEVLLEEKYVELKEAEIFGLGGIRLGGDDEETGHGESDDELEVGEVSGLVLGNDLSGSPGEDDGPMSLLDEVLDVDWALVHEYLEEEDGDEEEED